MKTNHGVSSKERGGARARSSTVESRNIPTGERRHFPGACRLQVASIYFVKEVVFVFASSFGISTLVADLLEARSRSVLCYI